MSESKHALFPALLLFWQWEPNVVIEIIMKWRMKYYLRIDKFLRYNWYNVWNALYGIWKWAT